MLQLYNIIKQYKTGDLVQKALNDVTLTLRDNEFVSILGPSGSGKTTLLNIIGGLDRYDSGDMVIDGISTKQYNSRNWDAYRNHSIGFVFQSYNLIPHQSILANVELALTIGGIKKKERRQRAEQALRDVGLEEHMHKRPNQLSGGQMQRVAIARALVNDPKIVLADEPTGALDTETGIQVMELLKKVAETKLVVMVTHNTELAEQYSTRIVRLRDGKIIGDTNPIVPDDSSEVQSEEKAEETNPVENTEEKVESEVSADKTESEAPAENTEEKTETSAPAEKTESGATDNKTETEAPDKKTEEQAKAAQAEEPRTAPSAKSKPGKSKMSFMTSLALSFNNLRTKTARTIITSVAGSIGIIGIALILALSQGVSDYTIALQRDAIESYPITIQAATYDYSSIDWSGSSEQVTESVSIDGKVTASVSEQNESETNYMPEIKQNNLGALKNFFEDPANNMDEYVGTGSVVYTYNTLFYVYTNDKDGNIVNTSSQVESSFGITTAYEQNFTELPKGRDNNTISRKAKEGYEMIYGSWPENDDEFVLITENDGTFDASTLVKLGFLTIDEYRNIVKNPDLATSGKEAAFSYEELCSKKFTVLPSAYRFVKNKSGYYDFIEDSNEEIKDLIKKYGFEMKISGIIKPISDNNNVSSVFSGSYDLHPLGYCYKLTDRIINCTSEADVVKAQLEDVNTCVLNGFPFNVAKSDQAAAIRKYIDSLPEEKITEILTNIGISSAMSGVGELTIADGNVKEQLDLFLNSVSDNSLVEMYTFNTFNFNPTTLEEALQYIGYSSFDNPSEITIYPDTFDGKQQIMKLLQKYNEQASPKNQIYYYDMIEEITNSIAQIVFGISLVLISFVSISLVVSCIMIGIITHISVLERTKEIGILRALGASKANISQVFNAETFIIGLLSGLIGILTACILCIPMNIIISQFIEEGTLIAFVPPLPALGLILISTIITMIGGLIPAAAASRKDPVIALRTE